MQVMPPVQYFNNTENVVSYSTSCNPCNISNDTPVLLLICISKFETFGAKPIELSCLGQWCTADSDPAATAGTDYTNFRWTDIYLPAHAT